LQEASHRLADLLEMAVIHAGADMHMQPHEMQAITLDQSHCVAKFGVPYTVFAALAAGIRLFAVPVTEARIDADPDPMAWRKLADLVEHVDGADIHLDPIRQHAVERPAIEDVR
jgi:hypothetical protein